MKKKALGLIEELNPSSELLTDDPDIAAKINFVVNQVMYDLVRIKKIPKYVELEVRAGDVITFDHLEEAVGYEIFLLGSIHGVKYLPKAEGTVLKILEDGTAEIECYVYPERITDKTRDKAYEFEIPADLLEIMPYGIAADLLKNDASAGYGNVYASRYESMKQTIEQRYQTTMITIEGGFNF
jgi:hypothetical protein